MQGTEGDPFVWVAGFGLHAQQDVLTQYGHRGQGVGTSCRWAKGWGSLGYRWAKGWGSWGCRWTKRLGDLSCAPAALDAVLHSAVPCQLRMPVPRCRAMPTLHAWVPAMAPGSAPCRPHVPTTAPCCPVGGCGGLSQMQLLSTAPACPARQEARLQRAVSLLGLFLLPCFAPHNGNISFIGKTAHYVDSLWKRLTRLLRNGEGREDFDFVHFKKDCSACPLLPPLSNETPVPHKGFIIAMQHSPSPATSSSACWATFRGGARAAAWSWSLAAEVPEPLLPGCSRAPRSLQQSSWTEGAVLVLQLRGGWNHSTHPQQRSPSAAKFFNFI